MRDSEVPGLTTKVLFMEQYSSRSTQVLENGVSTLEKFITFDTLRLVFRSCSRQLTAASLTS